MPVLRTSLIPRDSNCPMVRRESIYRVKYWNDRLTIFWIFMRFGMQTVGTYRCHEHRPLLIYSPDNRIIRWYLSSLAIFSRNDLIWVNRLRTFFKKWPKKNKKSYSKFFCDGGQNMLVNLWRKIEDKRTKGWL